MESQLEQYNDAVERLRHHEYPMLKDSVYLDHAGSTLCAKSLMEAFAQELTCTLYGNPHAGSLSSQLSASRIDDIRLRLLHFLNGDPSEYDLVFVANATAGVKLVLEAMKGLPDGYSYIYHQSCHTSLVGAREDAKQSLCVDTADVMRYLEGEILLTSGTDSSATLFAYSAQSHMDGQRFPLTWPQQIKQHAEQSSSPVFTLVDAASLCATSRLDLGSPGFSADFVVLSLYKLFGFPDLGALVVRRSAGHVFDHRRYFGGGTVDLVTCSKEDQWHAPKTQSLHDRLEDGTLPFHSIMALDSALRVHARLFGGMDQVRSHTSALTRKLFDGMRLLKHGNSLPACVVYSQHPDAAGPLGVGPIVSFNFKDSHGEWVSLEEVEKLAVLHKVHLRTGGVCSPGNVAAVLSLEPWELKRNLSAGFRCGVDNHLMGGKPAGVIRVSFGAMSTQSDVDRFLDFAREFFVEDLSMTSTPQYHDAGNPAITPSVRVKSITVYPIKSCGGYPVPVGSRWEVKPEGLAWDREWCLIHLGSGQVLSQKGCPEMALLRPELDFDSGILRVSFAGAATEVNPSLVPEVQIPIAANPSLFENDYRRIDSRVCGEQISALAYVSPKINNFFSDALGVQCVLARFPAGGKGLGSRIAKARVQKHQRLIKSSRAPPGPSTDIPSPPDSDTEASRNRILLSNESPVLLVNSSSLHLLNEEIGKRGGEGVPDDTFRANIVVQVDHDSPMSHGVAYAEDTWSRIRIGAHAFKLLGACRRCQMVCVDQTTGQRRQEPLSTLVKTRRFDGKVFFGAHMRYEPQQAEDGPRHQAPYIRVGDVVHIDERLR